MLLRRFPEQARQRVYPCDMCAAWHLTKLPGRAIFIGRALRPTRPI